MRVENQVKTELRELVIFQCENLNDGNVSIRVLFPHFCTKKERNISFFKYEEDKENEKKLIGLPIEAGKQLLSEGITRISITDYGIIIFLLITNEDYISVVPKELQHSENNFILPIEKIYYLYKKSKKRI